MLVILLLGTFAVVAAGFGLFVRNRAELSGRAVANRADRPANPKQEEMVELFVARLRSGAIGVPDLIRLFRKEGRDPEAVSAALLQAMSLFPQLARRKDKLQGWIKEAEKAPL